MITGSEQRMAHALTRIANAALTDPQPGALVPTPRFEGPLAGWKRMMWVRKYRTMVGFFRRGKQEAYERCRNIAVKALSDEGLTRNVLETP